MLYFNARSIRNKLSDLESYIANSSEPADVICVTESWLKPNDTFVFSGYIVLRKDRENQKGGGCIIMIKSSLNINYVELSATCSIEIEFIAIDICTSQEKTRLAVIYSPPNCKSTQKDEILRFFNEILDVKYTCVLVGDLNCPHIDWTNGMAPTTYELENQILEELTSLGMMQLITERTHQNGNILDVLACNNTCSIRSFEVAEPISPTCDHFSIEFELQISKLTTCMSRKNNFSKADYDGMRTFFTDLDWEFVMDHGDIEAQYTNFIEAVHFAIQEFVPMQKSRTQNTYSHETKQLFKHKRKAFRHWKRTGTDIDKANYKELQRKSQRLARRDTKDYEQRLLGSGNDKRFYSYIKRKTKPNDVIPALKDNTTLIVDEFQKASHFNNYFSSVFTPDDGISPLCQTKPTKIIDNVEFTAENTLLALKSLPSSTSVGPDGIPNILLKSCAHELVKPLLKIFNVAFQSGTLPAVWKVAHVQPVFKNKGSRSETSNYRPISLTSTVCKVMERIIRIQMFAYLTKHKLISDNQHGFRSGFSTTTQLIEYMNDLTKFLDGTGKQQVDAAYLDFAKAFDTVSHEKLFVKLKSIGINGKLLAWLSSFLVNRTQHVKIGSSMSTSLPVTSGVPQGTVLGPILFSIYVNDIETVLIHSSIKIYADDCKIYLKVSNDLDCVNLENDLKAVALWAKEWQLSLSVPKCNIISFGTCTTQKNYTINENQLTRCSQVKDLGVWIESTLKHSVHCQKVSTAANYKCISIHRNFETKESEFLTKMFNTYVKPTLMYNTVITNPYLKKDINMLENVQRRYTKRIPGLRDLSYQDRLKSLGLHSLEYQRLECDLVMAFKILNNFTPLNPSSIFKESLLNTRQRLLNDFSSRPRQTFLSNRVVTTYNSLPNNIVTCNTVQKFKAQIRKVDLSRFLQVNQF